MPATNKGKKKQGMFWISALMAAIPGAGNLMKD
jgi:hypothetical protein